MTLRRRIAMLVIGATLVLALSGCNPAFCTERTLLGFLFCDPEWVDENQPPLFSIRAESDLGPADKPFPAGSTVAFWAESAATGNPLYPPGYVTREEWDLDGDGEYEHVVDRDAGTQKRVHRVFPEAGEFPVDLHVTTLEGDDHVSMDVVIGTRETDVPPLILTASPNPAMVGDPVRFEARLTVPNRTGVAHRWFVDGNAEGQGTGAQSFVTRTYVADQIGSFTARVDVTDDVGTARSASLRMTVRPATEDPPRAATAAARRRPARHFFALLKTRTVRPPRVRARTRLRGVRAVGNVRGRLLADRRSRVKAPAALAALLDARWTTRADLAGLLGARRQSVTATVLATPRRGRLGRACIKLRLVRKGRRQPTGTYRIVGGTGAAARLHARGRIRFQPRARGRTAIGGTVRAKTGRVRSLPRGCGR
jgi:hypothetical protein